MGFFKSLIKSKTNIVSWDIYFDQIANVVKTDINSKFDPNTAQVLGYISCLSNYFFICDERQIDPMKNLFDLSELSDIEPKVFLSKLEETLWSTLTLSEQKAYKQIMFLGQPITKKPILINRISTEGTLGVYKYELYVNDKNQTLIGYLKMNILSPNVILLPALVGILFVEILRRFKNEVPMAKLMLIDGINGLIEYFKVNDCRSPQTHFLAPNVIAKVLLEKYVG